MLWRSSFALAELLPRPKNSELPLSPAAVCEAAWPTDRCLQEASGRHRGAAATWAGTAIGSEDEHEERSVWI